MILVVVGTRPELLKMAPVVRLAKARGLPVHVHCTMQSPDLVDRGILAWDSQDGDTNPMGRAIDLRDVMAAIKASSTMRAPSPDFLVVQGDTRTAFEAAALGYERDWPVMHIEAGIRTYDLSAPWPEEGYRQMISRIAQWHACTTEQCQVNLWDEFAYRRTEQVRVTGSPIVESVRERAAAPSTDTPHVIITLHRRENRGHFADILRGVWDAIDLKCSYGWYAHPNGWAAQENPTGMVSSPPLPAHEFAPLLARTKLVVTDSGGVQEEANVLGVPCVVARTVTDRPESLGPKGGAILGGNTRESISAAIQEALQLDRSKIRPTIFGDGKASERIVDWWTQILEGKC